jgi:SSS family solute:Na+ symporter
MTLHWIDWAVIIAYLIFSLAIGFYYAKQAGKNTENYFLGGRKLSWFMAGTSMVATTFAADTPLLVTELVVQHGISGNWLWWNAVIGGILTTFFFADLWRRANIVTDIELIEKRYSGKEASFLRGFKAIYMGVFLNSVVIAWVNVALAALIKVFFNVSDEQVLWYVAGAMLITAFYSSLSGFLGVVVTDAFQFVIAMTGCIILAIVVVNSEQIGGVSGLQAKLPSWSLDFFPQIDTDFFPQIDIVGEAAGTIAQSLSISLATFLAYIGFQWWASWYPGAEPGGGGYVVQRMMSVKTEKDAVKATLFFQIAHYCLRPWAWIIVGLCVIVLYPELPETDKKLGYILAIKDFMPVGLRGLLLVAFLAAYMSTISTQLNWGASYIINDFYKRFVKPQATENQFVMVSRLATFVVMIVAMIVTTQLSTMENAFKFVIECGAGLGLVLIMRWYWWRINAWSEIAATLAPFIPFGIITYCNSQQITNIVFPHSFFMTIAFTTVVWIIVTYLTKPTKLEVLEKFYREIQPSGFWEPIRIITNLPKPNRNTSDLFLAWFLGIALVYAILFFIGKLIFGDWLMASLCFGIAGVCAWRLNKLLQ